MRALASALIALACVATARAGAGAAIVEQPAQPYIQGGYTWPYYYGKSQSPGDLTIEQLRKLGLTPEQVQKVADARRDIERQRAALEAQIQAANSELARLHQEMRTLTTGLAKALEAVMTPEQAQAWRQQEAREQARQWLTGYRYWLKLTDAQVEEAAALLAPIFARYSKGDQDLADARARLAELRRADQVDVAAVDAAEKAVAQLTTAAQNVYQKRHAELLEAIRPALTPDQLEKVDKMQPARKAPEF